MCKYCEDGEVVQESNFKISIDDWFICVTHKEWELGDLDCEFFGINYCPYCGKKL